MAGACPNCGQENSATAKFCSECGASLAVSETQGRKIVTILFSDVTGSTSLGERLDPESLRGVMGRFYDIARSVVARHGGVVEKFIGDALMAVFGVPSVHEDDALRAVRAALDLVRELEGVNDELEVAYGVRLAIRTGINTGEVAVGAGEVFATGDAVNVAARLEQSAEPGEILISGTTRALVRGAVEVEATGPLDLKGKAAAVDAWRLRGLIAETSFERQLDTPLIGREHELEELRRAYDQAVAERSCRLFTVLGPAGIGKSRLVHELVASAPDAHALTGRCLPYGEGITYWAIATVVRRAADIDEGLGAADALARLRSLLAAQPDADVIADRIASAIGLGGRGAPAEEIFWAVRKLLETLAGGQPLIVVLDDIQWAEPTLLDLIDYLADRIEDVPVLLVCLARDELLEARPQWAEGKPNAATVQLDALERSEIDDLIAALGKAGGLDETMRERIAGAADGNPLFVEEMLAILPEDSAAATVPPTIQALLAARLDRLGGDERAVAGAASVVGQEFSRRAISALADQPRLADTVAALVDRRFFRAAEIRDEPGWFRFWHLLSQDAAYAALPKMQRSELHERFARFLEHEAGERVAEIEELVGYHLEQAYRQRIEVGLPDERAMRLAGEAAGRLAASGGRASARGDVPAAANLLQRALALLPPNAPQRTDVQLFLGATLLEQGRLADADEHLADAEESARETGSRVIELSAQIMRLVIGVQRDPAVDFDAAVALCDAAIGELEQLHADAALAGAWRVLTMIHIYRSDAEKAGIAAASALEQARRAGYVRGEGEAVFFLTLSRLVGPTPAEEALRDCEQLLVESPGPMSTASVLTAMGMCHALLGRSDEGRRFVREGRDAFRELGFLVFSEDMALNDAWVEFHAGDAAAAEQVLQRSTAVLESIGETSTLSIQHAVRALFVARLGRFEEALDLCERSERGAVAAVAQALSRSARAVALAGLGRIDEAVPLAREAVEIMRRTTAIHDRGTTCSALADVLISAGEDREAQLALDEARDLFERKGCVVCAAHALDRLEALGVAERAL